MAALRYVQSMKRFGELARQGVGIPEEGIVALNRMAADAAWVKSRGTLVRARERLRPIGLNRQHLTAFPHGSTLRPSPGVPARAFSEF
jgi:hypothetical protein